MFMSVENSAVLSRSVLKQNPNAVTEDTRRILIIVLNNSLIPPVIRTLVVPLEFPPMFGKVSLY